MALVRVTLTFAERHLCNQILNDLPQVDLKAARNMREVSRVFELREVRHSIEEMTEIAEKTPEKLVRWTDILDYEEETKTKARNFTIDDSYVVWLRELLEQKDWNKIVVVNPQTGERREETISISLDHAIVVANLVDALAGAASMKGEANEK